MGSDRATPQGVGQRKRTRMPERAAGTLSFPYAQDGRKQDGLSPEAGRVAMVALLVAAVAAIAGVTAATMVSDWVSPAHREAAIAQQFAQTRPPAEPNVNPQATMVQALTETGDAKAHQTAASAALVKTAAVSAQETATRVKAVALTRIAAAPTTAVEDAGTAMATVAEPIACEALDFEVVLTPTIAIVGVSQGEAELRWRVRNRATTTECMWGSQGEEVDTLSARDVTGQITGTRKVELTWVGEAEYDLALRTSLSPGEYTLRWQLLLPATGEGSGPDLVVTVAIVTPTPTPKPTPRIVPTFRPRNTPTPQPTVTPAPQPTFTEAPTPCPTEQYDCQCKDRCRTDSVTGRTVCTRVCDRCTRTRCN